MNRLKIGLTMRAVDNVEYFEPRDALARDWSIFMKKCLPEVLWMPLPNLGSEIIDHIKAWDLKGFIITGGNDLFEKPKRDETEIAIIKYAEEKNIPLFGVCRGLQIILHYFGHKISPCHNEKHAGTRHKVHLLNISVNDNIDSMETNSFHNYCAGYMNEFSGPLIPIALDSSGRVEGVRHIDKKILAVMWHPEREQDISDFDLKLVRKFFKEIF